MADQDSSFVLSDARARTEVLRERVSLRQIFSLAEPEDSRFRAVRKVQVDNFVKLVPATVATQLLAALAAVASFRDVVDSLWLGLWFGTALLLCLARFVRSLRLRYDADYAASQPARLKHIVGIIVALAMLWQVPAVFWFDQMGPEQQLFLCVMCAAMLSAGPVTMVSVPQAAMAYVSVLSLTALILLVRMGDYAMLGLMVVYSGMLIWAVVANARHFIDHVLVRIALEERGEIYDLLREFEAAGSGGLWELDSRMRVKTISKEMAQSRNQDVADLVGMPVRKLLDPTGKALELSSGMRRLLDHLERGEAFRDIAVPAMMTGRWWSLSGKPITNISGDVVGWRGIGSDITERRFHGDAAVAASRRDPLTGLANRLLVREHLEGALLCHAIHDGNCALMLVDLDRFKLVNDTLGHAIGDQLLVEVGKRLERTVGTSGHVGRLGGDEFAIVWEGSISRPALAELAMNIIADLSKTFEIGAASLHIGATIGVAIGPVDGKREGELMRAADLALYHAKEAGRGSHAFFEPQLLQRAEDHRLLENDVREALAGNGLGLAYQPIVDAQSGAVVGREALLRWHHPVRGDISPDLFIPIIEDSGLIHQIGDWVIREACTEAVRWADEARIAVNVSAAQLSGKGLAKTVLSALAASGLKPSRLELEVTESVFLGDDTETLASLERLRALGVRLVLDDFGKGYSSFGYLSRANFAKIKIEQSFVRGAAGGARDCVAIVRAILALARGLGIETTAEGVETEDQAAAMRRLGVGQMQGFLFGRPTLASIVDSAATGQSDRRSA